MANRLAGETSPYLQQHAQNPVDWYPWGEEALERARREDRPILLSVGYSACHWCHVMARECFEDAGVATVMNRLFVNVKVDREERPDLDQIYQTAHQVLAQRPGGWPLTMFLTPQGAPFFGGTYFPKSARHGLPGFADLCERVAQAWREKRAAIETQNAELLATFARLGPQAAAQPEPLSAEPVGALLELLRTSFDARYGGFGTAPKFPHPGDLELCLREGERDIALVTLERMCEGGIYDQLGGGFCRYSVDAHWAIPHFEKMLYDNGPLLGLLADAWLVSREPLLERCAVGTAGWLMREMQSPEGGYYSSLDADSEHEEGRFYVWQRDEAQALLGPQDYALFSRRYGLDQPPNFENRAWHLRIAGPLEPGSEPRLAAARDKLFAARERRVRPGRDEKILASWNALAIRGMARAARRFGRADWEASARRALAFLRGQMWRNGRLRATYKDGRAHLDAYLDDYAFLLDALLELLQLRFCAAELEFACTLADALLDEFEDRDAGGFFFTGRSHEKLIHRPKSGQDNATASGNAVAASALARLSALSGRQDYAQAARRTLELFHPAMRDHPAGFAAMALALRDWLAGPKVLVLRGPPEGVEAWRAALAREYLPDTTVLALAEGEGGLPAPLDKPVSKGKVNGWLCRGVTCLPPIDDLVNLLQTCKEPL
ncbi:MAG TPA: thioredoxin domain-containing protein [Burkholderiales bacterium]|nr:thioredoxin domain-containing protein [Burkholderiales bacterium]